MMITGVVRLINFTSRRSPGGSKARFEVAGSLESIIPPLTRGY
jgi:hypothetical protein